MVIFPYLVWYSLCSKLFWELQDNTEWSGKKFAILTLKPRNHVRILIYRTWATVRVFVDEVSANESHLEL